MHSSMFLGAALAMGALAVPLEDRALKIIDVMKVVTVTVTSGQSTTSTATSTSTSAAAANANGQGFLEGPTAAPKPAPAASAPAPVSGGPVDGGDITSVVNHWRAMYGLNELVWNHAMDANIQQVGQSNQGVNEIHTLIDGMSMGQCIAPGQHTPVPAEQPYSPFELVYLAWLCEVSTDAQLQPSANNGTNPCQQVQDVLHMEYNDRGHHDILVNPDWKSFSCGYTANPQANQVTAIYQGIWICDYAEELP